MPNSFKIGDLVWAKMKGFPPWPGKVSAPPADISSKKPKKASSCIYFFGSRNYAWIEDNFIKPYQEHKETLEKSNKSVAFKEACAAIEQFIEKGGENDEVENEPQIVEDEADALFNKIKEEASTPVAEKPKPKKSVKKEYNNTSRGSTKRLSELQDSIKKKKPKIATSPSTDSNHKADYSSSDHLSYSPKVSLLSRPATDLPESPSLDLATITTVLKDKNVKPSDLKFGFLGLGIMGSGIVKNMLHSGHKVIVWNRSQEKVDNFVVAGAEQGLTPSDVVQMADITFSCVADPQAAKDLMFGNCGVLSEMTSEKAYVEMTGIDPETSKDLAEAVLNKGGRYLEAQIQGSKTESEKGQLVIITAGTRSVFDDCQSCFIAMGINSLYLGEVGNASKMNLMMQLLNGIVIAGLSEVMVLANRAGLKQKSLLDIIALTSLNSSLVQDKGKAILENLFPAHQPLTHLQKDVNLALELSHSLGQPCPLSASTNEMYKHAIRLGYGSHDAAAVYIRSLF